MKGQISIEMILILAAILAVAFILATQLQNITNKASDAVEQKTDQILELADVNPSVNGNNKGDFCLTNADCPDNLICVNNYCE
jgi:archaellum component FlaG (FlaF/FlaG flagellin family)